jgi:hypothetical protein
MHTLRRGQTHWEVVFVFPDGAVGHLYNCDQQQVAAEIVSFLNGGSRPAWLPVLPANEVLAIDLDDLTP